MGDIKELLMNEAKAKGCCAKGFEDMRNSDIDELIDYYLANPDWCMERNFPTLEVLREHFSHIEDKGVFVDKTFAGELLNERQVYVFHNCKGAIKVGLNVKDALIPMLYIANNCRLRIVGVGDVLPSRDDLRTEIPIYSFGKNDISARSNRYVEFFHYRNKITGQND